jgi:hypothetical protein
MLHWIILATRWRRDGTPYPPRKLILCLEQGDSLAIAVLCVVVAFVLFKIHRFFHES